MTDIILQGICGRMGHALIEKISQREDCRVVAGIDQQAARSGTSRSTPAWTICRCGAW